MEIIRYESPMECDKIVNIWAEIFGMEEALLEKLQTVFEDGTIAYLGNGNPADYGTFGMLITGLKDKPWFMNYLDK